MFFVTVMERGGIVDCLRKLYGSLPAALLLRPDPDLVHA
jgi:hypothetical protein